MKQLKLQEKDTKIMFFEHKTITRPNPFRWGGYVLWFPKAKQKEIGKFKKICFSPY